MRGKAVNDHVTFLHVGITPAYAGKRKGTFSIQDETRDHPRLCGEKALNGALDVINKGSPPPMRGKACHFKQYVLHKRITPAYAGKSTEQTY